MAINKNFVIKNGVEVNTNLLVGDSTLNKVGIATTVPGYTLHIGVGDGARGGIGATDITVTGIATIGVANSTSGALSVTGISTFEGLVDANGGISARTAAVQDLTDNRVVIAGSGGELEDSANLTFDGSTLTVSGDLDPTNVSIASTLQVAGVATFLSGVLVSGIGTFESDILPASDGAVDLGSSSKEFQDLFIDGTANIDSLAADTAAIADLTDNRVVIAGSSGELEDDANFTFDGTKLNVGSGVATVFVTTGNAAFAGIVTTGGALLVGAGATISGDILPDADGSRDLGSSTKNWKDLYVGTIYATSTVLSGQSNISGSAQITAFGFISGSSVSASISFNGNKVVSNEKLPQMFSQSFNPGTSGSVQDFLNAVFFPNTAPSITTGNQTIEEFRTSGSAVVTLAGTDAEGQSLTFSTASSYTADKVRVASGGEITLTELATSESFNTALVGGVHGHLVTVKATDTFLASTEKDIYIIVTPNEAPKFRETSVVGNVITNVTSSVNENSTNSTLIKRIFFTDAESDTITINSSSISPAGGASHFTITKSSTYVDITQNTGSLDYETYPTYTFSISASDEHYQAGHCLLYTSDAADE